MIPPSFIQDLLSRCDIVEVVGRHVDLKKAGINHKGLCPFHGEKSPSFIVSPTRQTYHCFGCGVHGNAIGFLMEQGSLSFPEAVRELAGNVGMAVPEDDSTPEERAEQARAKERQLSLTETLARAADHYRQQLRQSPRAIDYLKGRGLTGEIAARFAMGYAPDGWRSLASVFPHYDDPLLVDSGLVIKQGEDGDDVKRYDRFRDRVMFPIRSVQGDVIGFGGRVLDSGEPKYLNSPETPVFSKGRELYGLFEARQALREMGYALVVEGYMDVVALAQWGFGNAVATLGTACTAEHVHKLFRFSDSVVFSFDGDAAGRRAAGRALEAALPHATDSRTVKFLFLPTEHDPDSYVREHGTEAFAAMVAQAVPLSRQLLETAKDGCDLGSAEGRARLLVNAQPLWAALPEGSLKQQLLNELAELGHLPRDDIYDLWHGGAKKSGQRQARANSGDSPRSQAQAYPGSGRRTNPARRAVNQGAVNLLDRALWLLLHHCAAWDELSASDQQLLADQPAPYGPAFALIERQLHHEGPQVAQALTDELQRSDVEGVGALALRISGLWQPLPEVDLLGDLRRVMDRLTLQGIEDELKALFDSGELSPDALARARTLNQSRAELKGRLSQSPGADL